MTSRWPYWCLKTMKRRPCWCPKPFLWEFNSFLMQTLSFVPTNLHRCWPRQWKHSMADITVVTIKCVQVGRLAFLDSQCTGGRCSVAVVSSVAVWSSHLSTNGMRFYFFQSKCVVIVSSLCDFPTRGGLWYEFCSFRFPDPVEDLSMKQFCSVFPVGFLENFTEVRSMFETFLAQRVCSYVGELESLGQRWKHKPRAQINPFITDSVSFWKKTYSSLAQHSTLGRANGRKMTIVFLSCVLFMELKFRWIWECNVSIVLSTGSCVRGSSRLL